MAMTREMYGGTVPCGQLSEETYRIAVRALGGARHLPVWAIFLGAGMAISLGFYVIPSRVFGIQWDAVTGTAAGLLLLAAIAAIIRALVPHLDRYREVLPRVLEELYPGCRFGVPELADIEARIPCAVRDRLGGVARSLGALAFKCADGCGAVYSLEGTDRSGDEDSPEPYLLIEVPLSRGPLRDMPFLIVDNERTVSTGGVSGALRAAAHAAGKGLRSALGANGLRRVVPGSWIEWEVADENIGRAVCTALDAPTVRALETYFDRETCGNKVIFAEGCLYVPLRKMSLAFEQGHCTHFSREGFAGHAACVQAHMASACSLARALAASSGA